MCIIHRLDVVGVRWLLVLKLSPLFTVQVFIDVVQQFHGAVLGGRWRGYDIL